MMKRAIVVGPLGEGVSQIVRDLKVSSKDYILAVDRGVRTCWKFGLEPRLAVGDWDSITTAERKRVLKEVPHLTLSREKDFSDLHHALMMLADQPFDEVICVGLTGGRPDHHLAVLMELGEFARLVSARVSAWGPEGEYHFVAKTPLQRTLKRGSLVSVFALGGPARGVTLRGLEYSLKDAELAPSSHGLSNRTTRRVCEVSVKQGGLLVVVPRNLT